MTHNNNNVNVNPELHKVEVRKDLATNGLTKNDKNMKVILKRILILLVYR